jgi:hypothetical protein
MTEQSPPVGDDSILPASHWETNDDADADSSLGSDAECSTASITSSIFAYRELHGRRYHSDKVTDGQYWCALHLTHQDWMAADRDGKGAQMTSSTTNPPIWRTTA